MRRDLATTLAAEAVVIGLYLLTFKLVTVRFAAAGFAEYSLSRRALTMVLPLAVLGTDVAVARFVSYAAAGQERRPHAAAAILSCLAASAVVAALLIALQGPFATALFASAGYARLVPPLALLVAGGALHGVAYGELRGRLRIQEANLLLIVDQAVVPAAAALLAPGGVAGVLAATGGAWVLVAGVWLARIRPSFGGDLRGAVGELLRFGVPRVPGDLLQLALFGLPAVVVAHVAGVVEAGTVAFAIAAVGMVGTAMSPVSFVLLPVAARRFHAADEAGLARELRPLLLIVIAVLVVGVVLAELAAPLALTVYLGPSFAGQAGGVRLVILAALPWGVYMALRGILDARHVRPLNARNMTLAFLSFAVLAGLLAVLTGAPETAVLLAFVAALSLLGVLTLAGLRAAVKAPAAVTLSRRGAP